MRFLHTSDWHLGASDGDYSLLEDQHCFLQEIYRIIAEKKVDAVLLAGDVFDRSVPSAEAIRLYDEAVTHICKELDKPLLMIAGNHDGSERLASCSELLRNAGLYICGTATREPAVVPFPDTDVYLLPWITEERIRSLFPEQKGIIHSVEDAYRVMAKHLKSTFIPDKKHLLVSHAFITNAETSTSDRAAEIGFATQVSASVFDGFDYVALGHIHKPQDVNAHIRYCGTPMAYSFGKEETQEKSITVIDTADLSREIVKLHPLHRRTTLTGTAMELQADTVSQDVRDGYVRLCITDSCAGLELLGRLRSIYPHILEYAGKSYEAEDSSITLSREELERLENDPLAVFSYYCREQTDIEPDEHLLELFRNAVQLTEEDAL